MKVLTKLDDISEPFNNAVVIVGNLDGVHVVHEALFQKAIEQEKTLQGTAVLVTFEFILFLGKARTLRCLICFS